MFKKLFAVVAFICTFLGLAAPASAAIVTTDITTAITDAGTAAGVVGLAVVVMTVGIKVFKWLRRAL